MAATPGGIAAQTRAIRAYYDQNTRLFLRFGSSSTAQTIHRAVWADGAAALPQALNYTNRLLAEQAQAMQARFPQETLGVLDLGCGVGASLFYLAEHLDTPFQAVGLTLSGVQARLAGENAMKLGYTNFCAFAQADFLHVPLASGFQLAFSIEAFIHAPNPEAYLAQAARLLVPGGRLALCDDFLDDEAADSLSQLSRGWLQAYQEGWQAVNLIPASGLKALAAAHGLRLLENRDLTPSLRLRSLPDGLARLLLNVGRRLPQGHAIVPSMLGSMALQQCLRMGLIRYRWIVLEKIEP